MGTSRKRFSRRALDRQRLSVRSKPGQIARFNVAVIGEKDALLGPCEVTADWIAVEVHRLVIPFGERGAAGRLGRRDLQQLWRREETASKTREKTAPFHLPSSVTRGTASPIAPRRGRASHPTDQTHAKPNNSARRILKRRLNDERFEAISARPFQVTTCELLSPEMGSH